MKHLLTLAAMACVVGYQLLLPPVVGLADQGDYARLLGKYHLGPVAASAEERYYRYFNRTYKADSTFKLPGWDVYSTQDLFVGAAVLLNKWISKDGLFDIRVLSALEIAAMLAVIRFLLIATRPLVPSRVETLICLALIVVFCDVGYISYFNSFYSEPATYIFLLALVAAWLTLIGRPSSEPKYIMLVGLFALLFIGAKPQNVAAGVILAVYMLRFQSAVRPSWVVPLVCASILAVALVSYWTVPRLVRLAQIYNMVFMEVLPHSSDRGAELRSMGLDSSLAKYSGSGAFAPLTTFWNPAFQRQLDTHVSRGTILYFYLRHPGELMAYIRGVLPRGASLRAEGVGNFERSAGYPPFARSRAFAIWSRLRERVLSPFSSLVLIGFIIGVPLGACIARLSSKPRAKLLAEFFSILALMAVAVFFTTILGDAHDLVKHLHLYNLLTDICIVSAIAAGLSVIARIPAERRDSVILSVNEHKGSRA